MIIYLLLLPIYTVLETILAPFRSLGDVSMSSDFLNSMATIPIYLGNVNKFIPAYSIVAVVGLIVSIEAGIFSYKAVKWGYSKIPGIS
jgi:hypothetical protein